MIRRRVAIVALVAIAGSGTRAQAQTSVLLQGIADGEFWSTSATSNLLTRNGGRPGGLTRLQLWGAAEPLPGLVFYAQGTAEGGNARIDSGSFDVYAEQWGARYIASRALTFDVGRLAPVIGTFAARRFSNRNPLIGEPDGYSLDYPLGAELFGETDHIDYRAAMVSLPASHAVYVPTPTPRYRPAVGAGITPFIGFHLGASATVGPYLNDDFTVEQLAGKSWSDYNQRVVALDAEFARGYLETHAEFARGSYDVPGFASVVVGYTYYGEAKYTLTPRFFLATRIERNDYPFIRPISATTWIGKLTDFVDGEIGGGYRVTPSTLLKVSVRADRWWVKPGAVGFLGQGGRAVAMQFSQAFDVMDWFTPRR